MAWALVPAIIVAASLLRLHNAWHTDPHWGIDPACHVPLMEFVMEHGRRPLPSEFEWAHVTPFFYYAAGYGHRALRSAGLSDRATWRAIMLAQAAINIAGIFAVWSLAVSWCGRDWRSSSIAVAVFSFLPANIQLAMQFSNEGLQQTLLLWSTAAASRLLTAGAETGVAWTGLFAVTTCLAAAIKINALSLIAASTAFLGLDSARRRRIWLGRFTALGLGIALALAIYFNRNDAMRANLRLDGSPSVADSMRALFRFDPSAVRHPFVPPTVDGAANQVFWTMLYLATFSDYPGVYHNQRRVAALPESQVRVLYPPAMYSGKISAVRYERLVALASWSLPFCVLFPAATAAWIARALRDRNVMRLFLPAMALAALAALFIFGISHPAGGNPVKAIYIMHALGAMAVILGGELAAWTRGRTWPAIALLAYIAPWIALSWSAHWMASGLS